MAFQHDDAIWQEFPELVAGTAVIRGVDEAADVQEAVARYTAIAASRLEGRTESDLPEIQAWRRAFARMGLKPTQYRCASESLLRRFRKEGELPSIHPVIDLCNAISIAFATPIAVFDLGQVEGDLAVRHAAGTPDERYEAFSGEIETPAPGEVIFIDGGGNVHARRWTHRQSGRSAIRPETRDLLVVSEAMHETASDDIPRLIAAVTAEMNAAWGVSATTAFPAERSPRVEFPFSGGTPGAGDQGSMAG
ncbi:MAG: phenylalanine--tRNA ligase beta subunit-related protein [Thermomicrobiales bacterium]